MADDKSKGEKQPELKTCFVASPIGHTGSPERRKADAFLKFIVTPATTALGYATPVRADQITEPGTVTSQIVRHLIESDVVIVDLTDKNPNVMYELAIRHAAQKPFVQLMTRGQDIPFDVGQSRTIFYDITDPFSIEETVSALTEHLKTCDKKGFQPDTPLARMLDIGNLAASGPRDVVLEKVLARLDSIESRVADRDIEQRSKMFKRWTLIAGKVKVDPSLVNWITSAVSSGPPEGVPLVAVQDYCYGQAYSEKDTYFSTETVLPTIQSIKELQYDPDTGLVRIRRP